MFAAAPLALTAASVSLSRGTEHDRLTMAAQLAATPGSVDLVKQDLTIAPEPVSRAAACPRPRLRGGTARHVVDRRAGGRGRARFRSPLSCSAGSTADITSCVR